MFVTYVVPAGEHSLTENITEVEFGGVKKVCSPCVRLLYTCASLDCANAETA